MAKNSNEIFIVPYCKFRLGLSIIFISALGGVCLLVMLPIMSLLFLYKRNLDLLTAIYSITALVVLFGALYIFKVAWKYTTILVKNKPMAVLNHHGYGGVGFKSWNNYNWTPETRLRYTRWYWSTAASIYTLKSEPKSIKQVQNTLQLVSIPLHLSNKSLSEVRDAFEYFNPFHQAS